MAADYVILEKADGSKLVPGAKYYAVVWPVMYSPLKFTFTDMEGNTAEKVVSGNYSNWFDCKAGQCERFNFKSALDFSEEPVLVVSQTNLTLDASGGDQSFSLFTNKNWTVTSDQTWLTVSPESGSASGSDQNVTVSATENTSADRTAKLTVTCGDLTETIDVIQKGPQINARWYYGDIGFSATMDYIVVSSCGMENYC